MNRYVITIFTFFLFVGLLGCNSNERMKNSAKSLSDSTNLPDSEVQGAQIELFDHGSLTSRILAKTINKFSAIDSTMGYDLDIALYDSTGAITSTIVGDSGIIREKLGKLEIFGKVVVISDDSSKLETDYLTWYKTSRKLKTDAFVTITDPDGSVVRGWGMEAEHNPTRYRILRQVSGTVKNSDEIE